MVVRADSGINKVSDLRGKRVANKGQHPSHIKHSHRQRTRRDKFPPVNTVREEFKNQGDKK
jgi:hypothetical protein